MSMPSEELHVHASAPELAFHNACEKGMRMGEDGKISPYRVEEREACRWAARNAICLAFCNEIHTLNAYEAIARAAWFPFFLFFSGLDTVLQPSPSRASALGSGVPVVEEPFV